MSVTPSPFPVGVYRPRRRGGKDESRRTYSRSRRAFKPADRSRRRPGRPAARSRTAQYVRPGARDPASVDGLGHNASRDRAGKVEQPRRQEINTVGRLVDDLVEHVERLAHQLICVLTQTRRGSDQWLAQAPADLALQARDPTQSDGVAQEPQISVRGIRSRPQVKRSAERLHVVTRHVDQRVHPGAGHGRDTAHPADPAPGDEADEHGLGLIVHRVPDRGPRGAGLVRDLGDREVPLLPRPRFDRRALVGRRRGSPQMGRQTVSIRQAPDVHRVRRGAFPEPVIEVEDLETDLEETAEPHERLQHAHGIRASGDRDQDRLARQEHLVLARRRRHPLEDPGDCRWSAHGVPSRRPSRAIDPARRSHRSSADRRRSATPG